VPQLKQLVVGLGNPLAGDDGFGGAVVERLRRAGGLPAQVRLLDAGTDLLGQIQDFAGYDRVVLVDAALGEGRPGEVAIYREEAFDDWPDTSPSSHQLSPLLAMRLFRQLHPESRAEIVLVALWTARITLGATVPEAAVEAGAEAVTRVLAAL
jgi:hydrogenase maturation protease